MKNSKITYDPNLVLKALHFAAKAHKNQQVPATDLNYMLHVTSVMAETLAAIAHTPVDDPTLAVVCAVLHDTIEDTDVTFADIVREFSLKYAKGVLALTKDKTLSKAESMDDSLTRILLEPIEIAVVKLADRSVNMGKSPAHWAEKKRRSYNKEANVIHTRLGHVHRYMAERLASRIQDNLQYI